MNRFTRWLTRFFSKVPVYWFDSSYKFKVGDHVLTKIKFPYRGKWISTVKEAKIIKIDECNSGLYYFVYFKFSHEGLSYEGTNNCHERDLTLLRRKDDDVSWDE